MKIFLSDSKTVIIALMAFLCSMNITEAQSLYKNSKLINSALNGTLLSMGVPLDSFQKKCNVRSLTKRVYGMGQRLDSLETIEFDSGGKLVSQAIYLNDKRDSIILKVSRSDDKKFVFEYTCNKSFLEKDRDNFLEFRQVLDSLHLTTNVVFFKCEVEILGLPELMRYNIRIFVNGKHLQDVKNVSFDFMENAQSQDTLAPIWIKCDTIKTANAVIILTRNSAYGSPDLIYLTKDSLSSDFRLLRRYEGSDNPHGSNFENRTDFYYDKFGRQYHTEEFELIHNELRSRTHLTYYDDNSIKSVVKYKPYDSSMEFYKGGKLLSHLSSSFYLDLANFMTVPVFDAVRYEYLASGLLKNVDYFRNDEKYKQVSFEYTYW